MWQYCSYVCIHFQICTSKERTAGSWLGEKGNTPSFGLRFIAVPLLAEPSLYIIQLFYHMSKNQHNADFTKERMYRFQVFKSDHANNMPM